MLCERCKKNQADVHLKQSINGEIREMHICSECASDLEYTPFSFHNMFQDLFSFTSGANMNGVGTNIKKCSSCGMTYDEFKRNGKLGCSNCFEAFGEGLENTLRSIHGSTEHKGKIPKKSGSKMLIKREISSLKRKLAVAVENEEFEEAAKLRDEIKKLSEGGGNQ